jgi:hypothetical protein
MPPDRFEWHTGDPARQIPRNFRSKKQPMPDEIFGQGFRLFSAYDERRRGKHRISLKRNPQIQHAKNKNAP